MTIIEVSKSKESGDVSREARKRCLSLLERDTRLWYLLDMQLLDNGCLPVDDRFGLLGFDDNGDLGCFRLWLGDVLLEPLEKMPRSE